jgi:hypothetical protein
VSAVNGAGAVDLAAVKQAAQQREQVQQNAGQIASQLLAQAGLVCPCGERVRSEAVIYFALGEETRPTPAGPQVGISLRAVTFHSRQCPLAVVAEQTALARRDGPAGRITWLDERRAARAKRAQQTIEGDRK